jgi:transcriptional regulator with XRE-family HTH domain
MSEELGKIIRAARALLGWHQSDLARASKVSTPTIWAIETGRTVGKGKKADGRRRVPNELTTDALKAALISADAELIDDDEWFGVKVRKKRPDAAAPHPQEGDDLSAAEEPDG